MTRTRATAAALVLAALLAGCGGSKGGDSGAGAGTTAAGKGSGGKDSGLAMWDENRKMNDVSGFSSPIGKAMGFDPANQDPAAEQAKFRARMQKSQEAVAECMRAQGFTYTPYVPDDQFTSFSPPAYELTRKEFVEKYGFGISTMTNEMNAPPQEDMPKPEDDPNFVYQQSLSPSDLEAYNKALYGEPIMEDPASGGAGGEGDGTADTTMPAYVPQGCQGEGEKAVNGGGASEADQTFMNEFNEKMNALYQKVQADRRVVDANRAYAACMAEKGYPEIDKQERAYEKVSEKMQPLWEAQGTGMASETDASGGATAATVVAAQPIEGGGPGGFTPPTFDPVKLKEVNDYEIGVAKADLACGKDVMKIQYEVQIELEQQFVDENAADLARYKDLNDRGVGGMG